MGEKGVILGLNCIRRIYGTSTGHLRQILLPDFGGELCLFFGSNLGSQRGGIESNVECRKFLVYLVSGFLIVARAGGNIQRLGLSIPPSSLKRIHLPLSIPKKSRERSF